MADWTTQTADAIERTVATIRDRTVVPAQKATRVVVYGLLASFFVLMAVGLLIVGAFRGLTVLTDRAWASYAILGGILVVAGWFCWSKRTK